jgi:hypothetical protein
MRIVRLRAALTALTVPCFALAAGCNLLGGDDDSPDPDSAEVTQADEDIAEGVSGTAVELLSAMIDAASSIEQQPLRSESVIWSSQTGTWTISGSDSYDDPDASGTASYTMTVQFLDDGTPQQYLDDFTDQIEITSSIQNAGNYHPQEHAFDVDYDFNATGALSAELQGTLIVATGAGSLSGSTETHVGQATVSRQQNASWTYSMTVDTTVPDDCPAGTFVGTTNNFTFDGTFDDGVASWTIRRNGAVVRQATDSISCGAGGGSQGQ